MILRDHLRQFRLAAVLLGVSVLVSVSKTGHGEDIRKFAVVVHPDNKYQAKRDEMKSVVRQLYLRERGAWPTKAKSKPLARPKESQEHQLFRKLVLRKTQNALERHWLALKQKNGESAPRGIRSTRVMLQLIRRNKGSFGIVPEKDAKKAGERVRILFTFP